jgi:hypothetical protein
MGLDWIPASKPKKGHEAEAEKILDELEAGVSEKKAEKLRERQEKIHIHPEDTLGAPCVGEDARATEWFRERYDEEHARVVVQGGGDDDEMEGPDWTRPFEELLEEARGMPVIELTDYKVTWGGSPMAGPLSFRGKVLQDAGLPDKLMDEAFQNHAADEACEFADRLEKAALAAHKKKAKAATLESVRRDYSALRAQAEAVMKKEIARLGAKGIEDEIEVSLGASKAIEAWEKKLDPEKQSLSALGPVLDAADWLRFWGEKGHGYTAWF